jgi:hypothetical protein
VSSFFADEWMNGFLPDLALKWLLNSVLKYVFGFLDLHLVTPLRPTFPLVLEIIILQAVSGLYSAFHILMRSGSFAKHG